MVQRLVATLATGLAVAALSAQAPPSPPPGTGLIVGQVVDAATGRGVGDVAVTAVLSRDLRRDAIAGPRSILTDGEGRFVLRELPAGTYQVSGRRSGYVEDLYGAQVSGGEGKPISLAEGGRFPDAKIRLWKMAAIGGTVVDDAGDPVIGLQVRALKRTLVAGRWTFGEYFSEIKYGARTDDRGEFRISDLEAGDYVVSVPLTSAVSPAASVTALEALRNDPAARTAYSAAAEGFAGAPTAGPGSARLFAVGDFVVSAPIAGFAPGARTGAPFVMYQTQFYPGATTPSSAQVISVKSGDERGGLNFALKPVRTWRVSGTVTGPAGAVSGIGVRLVQSDDSVLRETDVAATVTNANGGFTFLGVPPGQFSLRVLRVARLEQVTTRVGSVTRFEQAPGASPDPTLWAIVPVTVGDADVSDLAVTLSTGNRITGRLVFDGGSPKPTAAQLAALTVTVEQANGQHPARVGDDRLRAAGDAFATPELLPGKYIVNASAAGPWTVRSVTVGVRDITDLPLVVDGHEIQPITITFSDRPLSTLRGTIAASGPPAATATMFLFPVEKDAWLDYGTAPRRLRRAQSAQDGTYAIAGVPRGEYFAVALADDRIAEWRDPKRLDLLARIATRVTIPGEGEQRLDLSVQRMPSAPSALQHVAGADVSPETPSAHASGPFVRDDDGAQGQAPVRDGPVVAAPPVGTGEISGVVVSDDASAKPVHRVNVTLNSTEPRVGRTVVTDDAGRFTFAALPAARYSLTATKPAYLDARFGATKPGRPGTPITLGAGERSSVIVRITKGAVIAGVIRDARGEPVRGVAVVANRYESSGGERRLATAGRTQQSSDDRGQYRIFGLEAGEYYVNVDRPNVGYYRSLRPTTAEDLAAAQRELRAPAATATPASRAGAPAPVPPDMGYAAVFYPGTPLFSQASTVTVGPGDERTGIDIGIQLVPLARITARVVGPDGQPPASVQARLAQVIALPGLSLTGLDAGLFSPITDGTLRIFAVPPGEYVMHVGGTTVPPPPMPSSGGFTYSPSTGLGLPMWATVPLTVDGRNIDNLDVRLELGKTVNGRVIFDGTAPVPAQPPTQVFLRGPQLGGLTISKSGPATPAFSIDGVIPAGYRVGTSAVRGWTLKSAVVNGHDAADLPVDINTDTTDVVVTMTDKLTELSGLLQTPGGTPASNYFVIVFPKDPTYWMSGSRRIVSLRPSSDGRFVTSATAPLPPGDYLIAAVTDVNTGEWFDPAFLKALTVSTIPVTIAEGEKKRQDIQIK